MEELKRMEQQIGQLISMVAKTNEMLMEQGETLKKHSEMLKSHDEMLKEIKRDVASLKQQFEQEKLINQARFEELLKEQRYQRTILNYHREKIAANEEEIILLKERFQ